MPAKPMLDDIELQQVQKIDAEESEAVSRHSVPALDGDFLQDLGRRAVRIELNGVLTGPEAAGGLKKLREKFQGTEPVPFVADIATATQVDQMLIEELNVRELAGKPERFEYAVALLEFIPPPPPAVAPPPQPPPPPPQVDKATLVVEVIVDGQPNFDFSTVTVSADGPQSGGTRTTRVLTNRNNNEWTQTDLPAGQYTAQAVVSAPQAMSGSAGATLQNGQTTRVTIHLTPGAVIAQMFVVTFAMDKAFIEPCMREVLRDAAEFARNNPTAKLLISGNTDQVGSPGVLTNSDPYNQSLSERRARAVFAYLTFGRDRTGAVAEWQQLRQHQTVSHPTIQDNWDLHQVQYMLQDLEFYPGIIDGQDGPLTREAIRAFRCHVGLPPGTTMDDPTWEELIKAYLGQDSLNVLESQFFSNCPGEILKWTGVASQDPVVNVHAAKRQNRRVELLFVHATQLPCQIPQPDTFNLPAAGAVNTSWCLGPGDVHHRACFVVPRLPPGGQPQGNEWLRQPVHPGTFTVQGTIVFDDGTPYAQKNFVLIAPDGTNKADERSTGEPVPARTDANGAFQFADLPFGVYILEVRHEVSGHRVPVLARLQEEDDSAARGSIVCKEMNADTDRLNVVILHDPVLREIRVPVVVHMMTALHPLTRAVRTCPSAGGPPERQATAHTDAEIRAAFDAANQIWRQARIHFELNDADIAHETYSFRTECEVDDAEFEILLDRAADSLPGVLNVFFFGDLAGNGEAGFGISVENGASQGIAGCAVGDRFQTTILGPPLSVALNADQTSQVLAHELGHYLNLDHVTDTPANAGRLMLPGTLAGDNRTLIQDEVDRARASQGAHDDCVPLTLSVSGAGVTRIGASLSNRFIAILGSAGPVTVDAHIPDRMIDPSVGTLTMTGGDAGANNLQRTVATDSVSGNRTVEVVATYTPAGGGQPVTRRVILLVSSFPELRVEGARRIGAANSTIFITEGSPTEVVTVHADLDPAPFAIPSDLIRWAGGNAVPDPQLHTVSRAAAAETVLSATIAGVTRSVTIRVFLIEAVAQATAAAQALTFVRFGIWDNAYDAVQNVRNNAAENDNFVGADKRKFHFRVSDPTAAGTQISLNWKTLTAGQGNDDAPAVQSLTLVELAPGSKVFVSKAVMLVTDDTDRDFPTHSGFTPPAPDAGLRNAGQSNHRTRRAAIDGFVRAEYSPSGGGIVSLTLPLFERRMRFSTSDSTDNVVPGVSTLTPAAMSGSVLGLNWSIHVGQSLTIDTGANQEEVAVTAVTATTFTARFANPHNGTASAFQIQGFMTRFSTSDSTDNVAPGISTLTPTAMSPLIRVGAALSIDAGINEEVVAVTAVAATTFTAVFTKPHNGTTAAFPISVIADERKRVSARVLRYLNGAFPALIPATDPEIANQFRHANRRWNQVGIQIDPQPTADRVIPAAAIDATGVYGGSANNPQEQAALGDLIPVTPDDTLTVVFVSLSAANAYSTTFPRVPIPLPAGGTVTLDNRHFVFINTGLNLENETLGHELHHVLFNRGDGAVPRQFFTFNTNAPLGFGIPLPDVKIYRRIQNFHTPDPDNDPNNNNVINWAKRLRTARFPIAGDLNPAADNTTGNRLAGDF
ncbi:MAG TPA: OmpA family protein [Terriglobia bacterium]|nr:OmpA family protein [Terriglobia bacterium]